MRIISHQHPWSLNVWCGIVAVCVLSPYFFESYLNGPMYTNFLRAVFPQLLKHIPLNVRVDIWMQHDGDGFSTSTYAMYSRLIMNHMFPRRWIERIETVNWAACLPDLMSLGFFLWDFTKDRVISTASTTAEMIWKTEFVEAALNTRNVSLHPSVSVKEF